MFGPNSRRACCLIRPAAGRSRGARPSCSIRPAAGRYRGRLACCSIRPAAGRSRGARPCCSIRPAAGRYRGRLACCSIRPVAARFRSRRARGRARPVAARPGVVSTVRVVGGGEGCLCSHLGRTGSSALPARLSGLGGSSKPIHSKMDPSPARAMTSSAARWLRTALGGIAWAAGSGELVRPSAAVVRRRTEGLAGWRDDAGARQRTATRGRALLPCARHPLTNGTGAASFFAVPRGRPGGTRAPGREPASPADGPARRCSPRAGLGRS